MLAIWHDGSERTFAPGQDVVVGRDLRADVRIADPRISRAHLILRFEQGQWVAVDSDSVNGTFVDATASRCSTSTTGTASTSAPSLNQVRCKIRLRR